MKAAEFRNSLGRDQLICDRCSVALLKFPASVLHVNILINHSLFWRPSPFDQQSYSVKVDISLNLVMLKASHFAGNWRCILPKFADIWVLTSLRLLTILKVMIHTLTDSNSLYSLRAIYSRKVHHKCRSHFIMMLWKLMKTNACHFGVFVSNFNIIRVWIHVSIRTFLNARKENAQQSFIVCVRCVFVLLQLCSPCVLWRHITQFASCNSCCRNGVQVTFKSASQKK